MKFKSFKRLYLDAKNSPTPAQIFISTVAEITCREESTVRQWLSGTQEPPKKAKEQLSKAFGAPLEHLFPENENEKTEEQDKENDNDNNETENNDDEATGDDK